MIIISMGEMDSSFNQKICSSYDAKDEVDDGISWSSSFDGSSVVSTESDLFEEVNSSGSSSPTSLSLGSADPLQDLSPLLQQLPIKRGLSKHYNGKSQSFTCISNVKCLEDLAKPENPYNKKLKSCKSYGGLLLERHGSVYNLHTNTSSRLISKKTTARISSCSSLGLKRNSSSFLGNNRPPPLPPPSQPVTSTNSNDFANQTPLFA